MAALEFQSSFKNINQKEWNDLTKSNPFLRLEFFNHLKHQSQSERVQDGSLFL